MSKYEPLERFLRARQAAEVPMSFVEIEGVIGAKLPPAAHVHRGWWSNNPSNNVMTRSWLAAGYVSARVDMASGRLVFRRKAGGPAAAPEPAPAVDRPGLLARLQARLGGTVKVAPGVDLTEPTGEVWGREP